MREYPRSLAEFEAMFSTEEACRAYLVQLRWPSGFQCARCGSSKAWHTARGILSCAGCGKQSYLTAGTILQGTHQTLRQWFRAVWWVTSQKSGTSALGLKRILGFGSYRTAWLMLHKLRRAMVRPGRDRLSGRVEVDEAYVGGAHPGKRGRGAAGKSLVLVAAEAKGRGIGRIRLARVPDGSAKHLEAFVKDSVESGSLVHTDGNPSYSGLKSLGYRHRVTLMEEAAGRESRMLPWVHRVVSLLKRWLLGIHQGAVSHEHLDYYLDEFTFRFNRQTSRYRGKLFFRLLQQAMVLEPTLYRAMVRHARGPSAKHHNI